jgi:hypothetical protein
VQNVSTVNTNMQWHIILCTLTHRCAGACACVNVCVCVCVYVAKGPFGQVVLDLRVFDVHEFAFMWFINVGIFLLNAVKHLNLCSLKQTLEIPATLLVEHPQLWLLTHYRQCKTASLSRHFPLGLASLSTWLYGELTIHVMLLWSFLIIRYVKQTFHLLHKL